MYNRYIPQSDGSYLRKRIGTPPQTVPPPDPPQVLPALESPPPAEAPPQKPLPKRSSPSLDGFFSQLLPRGFDTGDLIVVLLLLLMAADCPDDHNTALLTLALYLFL